jgi:hypothetical protein
MSSFPSLGQLAERGADPLGLLPSRWRDRIGDPLNILPGHTGQSAQTGQTNATGAVRLPTPADPDDTRPILGG